MSTCSADAHPSMSLQYSVARTTMDTAPTTTTTTTSSETSSSINVTQSTSALSSAGWHSARANALNSSAMRGPAWRDVAAFSSPRPSPSPKNSAIAADRGPVNAGLVAAPTPMTTDVTRAAGTIGTGPSFRPDAGQPTSGSAVSPTQHAALAKSVNGFREFVAHLPSPTASAENVAMTMSAEGGLSRETSQPRSLEATNCPRFSLRTSVTGGELPHRYTNTSLAASQNTGIRSSGQQGPAQQQQQQQQQHQPLPPSTVPAHRIPTVAHTERVPSPTSSAQFVNNVSPSTLNRRFCATTPTIDPPKANDFRGELVQIQNNESGFVIVATRCRAEKEAEEAGDDAGTRTPTRASPQSSSNPGPSAFPADPLHESDWMASRNSEFMTSNNSYGRRQNVNDTAANNYSGNRHQAGDAFQRYLDETRATIMNDDVPAEDRVAALDALLHRSRELFDLLDNMHTSLVDGPDRRRYTLLSSPATTTDSNSRSVARSGQSSSLSDPNAGAVIATTAAANAKAAAATTTPAGAAAAAAGGATGVAAVAGASANSDEIINSNGVETLSLNSRAVTVTNQLPNLGPSNALRLLGGFERGRRTSFNSCSTTSQAYIDIVNNYCILRLIGIGATGRAYLALDRKTNHYYAMKTVAKRTRRSAVRQFPLRPPSFLSEECSVLEGARPMPSLPDNTSKLPPRYVNGTGNSALASAAGEAITPPAAAADGAVPTSIIRTACYPAATAAAPSISSPRAGSTNEPHPPHPPHGLREADMEGFAQATNHSSGLVIPYVESVMTGESASVSADGASRDNAVQAVLVEHDASRPSMAPLLQQPHQQPPTNSFARCTTASNNAEVAHTTSHNNSSTNSGTYNSSGTRPPIAPSAIRVTTPSAQHSKGVAAAPADVELSAVEREIRVMRRVQNHANVVQLREVIDDDDEDCAHLIMTYAANGPLTMVHGYDPAQGCAACNVVRPFSRCVRLLRQLADALIYVHRQRIVHNDVKPDNILLTDADNILLTDFGESVLIPKRAQSAVANTPHQQHQQHQQQRSPRADTNLNATVSVPHNRWRPTRASGESSWMAGGDFNEQSVSYRLHGGGGALGLGGNTLNAVSQMLMTEVSFRPDSSMFLAAGVDIDGRLNGDRIVVGSPAFAAPELIDSSTCSYKSDTWSFGVVLYAIVFGRLPFAGPSISETFDDILHAPLTFPPLDQVPQNAELSEAAYDQWVLLCSRLLVREPQERLSLHAMLRHPLFRSTMPPPTSPKSDNNEALASSSIHSAYHSRQPTTPDTTVGRQRTPQSRQGSPSEEQEDDLSPISRTNRAKPSVSDAASPPLSIVNESLSRLGSPTPLTTRAMAAAGAASEGKERRAPRTLSVSTDAPPSPLASTPTAPASTALILPSVPPPTLAAPPPPPSLAPFAAPAVVRPPPTSPPTLVCVPVPPSVRRGSIPSVPSKPPFEGLPPPPPPPTSLRRPSDNSMPTLSPANHNMIAQLPSVTPSQSTDTIAPPPSCASTVEDATATTALPTPPRHLREKTLIYYQSSELASSGRTASPKEGSLFSVSHRYYVESRRESSEMTPKLGTPLLGHTAASTQSFEKGEMRRLVLNSRESTVAPNSFRAPSYTGSEEASSVALLQKSTTATALTTSQIPRASAIAHSTTTAARAANSHAAGVAKTAAEREEEEDHVACDVSVGGATRKPQDDPDGSHNLEDAFSRQEAATDYYSYWNDSDSGAEEEETSRSGAEENVTAPPPPPTRRRGSHTPHDNHPGPTPVRRSVTSAKPRLVPVLSNCEEVPPGHSRRNRDSVVRTKREKSRLLEERRGTGHLLPPPNRTQPQPQPRPLPTHRRSERSASRATKGERGEEGPRRVSDGKRH